MMEEIMIKHTATMAALGIALIASPALAGEEGGQSMSIQYRDLNLSTPEGQAKLDQRIDVAARQVCGVSQPATGSRIKSRSQQACYEEARKSVKQQVAAMVAQNQRGG